MTSLPGPDGLRLSDTEREVASRALGEHFAQGRLDADEHAERHERVWSAKTRGQIPPLFADLPGGSPLHPARTPRAAGASPLAMSGAMSGGMSNAMPGSAGWGAPRPSRPRRIGVPLPVKLAFGIVLAVLVIMYWWVVLVALGVAWMLSHAGPRRRGGVTARMMYAKRGPCGSAGRWSPV